MLTEKESLEKDLTVAWTSYIIISYCLMDQQHVLVDYFFGYLGLNDVLVPNKAMRWI